MGIKGKKAECLHGQGLLSRHGMMAFWIWDLNRIKEEDMKVQADNIEYGIH
jgi:hypothetical protein